jgi:hypothetical protein
MPYPWMGNPIASSKIGAIAKHNLQKYLYEKLSNFFEGMSKQLRNTYGFVNVEGSGFHNMTKTVVNQTMCWQC